MDMTMTTITATPTLPASWQPTVAGCLTSSDYWMWDYGSSDDMRLVVGGPSQVTNCLPTSWAADVVYSGSECPPRYTSACQGTNSASEVTCCPTLNKFTCANPSTSVNHAYEFRCVSQWAAATTINVTRTRFVENNLAVETRNYGPPVHLWALAVLYVTSTSTDSVASTTQTSTSSQSSATSASSGSSSDSGLSTGAAAGIGVGAAVGVVLLAIFAWWIYRHRRSRRQVSEVATHHQSQYTPETTEQVEPNGGYKGPVPPSRFEMPESPPIAQELPAHPR
ncbi:hypothetical protein diail_4949 [Diaporthe ilicicola]|nr:hypothetical protein diail_4949 [Diaporthe ilicicola]